MSETENASGSEESGGGSIDPHSIEGLFLLALGKQDPNEREAYLEAACGDDEQRRRVKALLNAYYDAGSFLETPVGGPRPLPDVSLDFLKPSDKDGCLGTIGPYEILEVIGRGGMGVVMRAVDPKLNRVVAVKALLPELARNANARLRFLREAQAAAAISHPHVVTIHAVEEAEVRGGKIETPPYLVMECVVGHSLQERLDAVGSLRLAETLRISRQIAEGLAAAHTQGLIHRDIKPANILLENGVQRVKITDFGLARAIDDISVTRSGEVTGTPQYMSPEQASGQRVDQRSDLFSLGCVMYTMCVGHSPFRADNLAHVIKRVTQDSPRRIAEQNPEVPAWLEQIITCLLEKNPDHRFETAEGLVAILDQHLARLQQPSDSGSHSSINQQIPTAASARPDPRESRAGDASLLTGGLRHDASRPWGHFVFTILVALGIGAAISLIMNVSLVRADPQLVELQLVGTIIFAVGILLVSSLGILAKHAATRLTILRVLQTAVFLGTVVVGITWMTILRVPGASAHDFRVIGLLTLLWFGFCIYAGKKSIDWSENDSAKDQQESLHGRVGRFLISTAIFLIVFPLLLVAAGIVAGDGDVMESGGQFLVALLPLGLLAVVAGYVLRFVVDREQERHHPLNFAIPVTLALLLAAAGTAAHLSLETETMIVEVPSDDLSVTLFGTQPMIVLKHPEWKIRQLVVNGLGSTGSEVSKTETRLLLAPDEFGTTVDLYVILQDGREYSRSGIPLQKIKNEIVITEDDLRANDRVLVEVVQDMPEVSLRMIRYPTQKITKNEFHIDQAPFHKLLSPGKHRIVLDFIRDDWDVPAGSTQYSTLDYWVTVPDSKPIKLSLKEILEEFGSEAKIHRMNWNPDFTPLRQPQIRTPDEESSPLQP